MSGGATLNATGGVTIVLTGASSSSIGSVQESGTSTINITAPTTGPTAGMAIYQDRNAPSTAGSSFSGSTTQSITGAMYFPSASVSYSGSTGTSGTGASQCTQLIGYTLTFSGSTTFNANCSGVGVLGMGGGSTKLVE